MNPYIFFKSYRARYIWFVPDLPSPHILMLFFKGNFHLWKLSPKRCMLHSPRAVFSKIISQEGVFTNLWFFPQVLGCLWLEVRIARVRITGWKNLLINRSMLGLPTIDPTPATSDFRVNTRQPRGLCFERKATSRGKEMPGMHWWPDRMSCFKDAGPGEKSCFPLTKSNNPIQDISCTTSGVLMSFI